MAHLFPIKAASAILEPLRFLNERHSCVNMSERVQEKHSFSLAQCAVALSLNASPRPCCLSGEDSPAKPAAGTERSFLTPVPSMMQKTLYKIKQNSLI